ncbi:MAG TPA: hypothetical protein VG938_14375 [Verrucomicrobiae bacterium]|jgi:hypothetical protein|nr:hypothetical protein [Verrucomicrobiae bacterium]
MNTESTVAIRRPKFQLPAVAGVIERRMLVNFRCRPEALQRVLPAPFRPKLIHGWGVAGICLIRLGGIRPAFLPGIGGLRSENAAHRVAVEWDEGRSVREGVFIPRRDTNSVFNRFAGGKLFPGDHHHANFRVHETTGYFKLEMRSDDGGAFVRVRARTTDKLPTDSIFRSLEEASEFFQSGALGWSSRTEKNSFDGLELRCDQWRMEPLAIEWVESSFFDDSNTFPAGSVKFDSAFLMRDIAHEWHARGQLAIETTSI